MISKRGGLGVAAALGLAAAALIPAAALGGAHAASHRHVTLREHLFHPATANISRGDSVTWLWRDGETEHNVTFRGFHSRTQASGSYTVKFTHRGTFKYRCTIHEAEGMRGKVIVH